MITWSSYGQDAQEVLGRLRAAVRRLGVGQGDEFRVNSTTDGDQQYSSVAMDAVGNFFITWSSHQKGKSGWGIFGRQYLADGRDLGEEMRIDTSSHKDQSHPTVAMDSYGHAVVVWSGHGAADKSGVFMQRFDLTHTDLADGVFHDFGPEAHDHDHDDDAQGQQSPTHFAEPDLDLIRDVASAVGSRGARRNRVPLPDRPGFSWWRARRPHDGHRGSEGRRRLKTGRRASRPVIGILGSGPHESARTDSTPSIDLVTPHGASRVEVSSQGHSPGARAARGPQSPRRDRHGRPDRPHLRGGAERHLGPRPGCRQRGPDAGSRRRGAHRRRARGRRRCGLVPLHPGSPGDRGPLGGGVGRRSLARRAS